MRQRKARLTRSTKMIKTRRVASQMLILESWTQVTISRPRESQRLKLKTKKKSSTSRRSSRRQQRLKPIKKLKKVSNSQMMTMMPTMMKMRRKIPQRKTKRKSLPPLHKRKNR